MKIGCWRKGHSLSSPYLCSCLPDPPHLPSFAASLPPSLPLFCPCLCISGARGDDGCPSVCKKAGMSCFNWSWRYVDRPDRGNRWQRDMPKVIWRATVGIAGFEIQHPPPSPSHFHLAHFLFFFRFSPSLPPSTHLSFFHLSHVFITSSPLCFPFRTRLSCSFRLILFQCFLSPLPKVSCTCRCLSLLKHTGPEPAHLAFSLPRFLFFFLFLPHV